MWPTPKFKIKSKTCSHCLPISEHVPPLFKTPYQVLLSLVCDTQSFGWPFRTPSVWLLCPLTSCLSPGALQLLSSASSLQCRSQQALLSAWLVPPLPGPTNPIQPLALSPSAGRSQRTPYFPNLVRSPSNLSLSDFIFFTHLQTTRAQPRLIFSSSPASKPHD